MKVSKETTIEPEQNPAAAQQAGNKEKATSPSDMMVDLMSTLSGKGTLLGCCCGCCFYTCFTRDAAKTLATLIQRI